MPITRTQIITNLIIDPSYKGVMEVWFFNDVDDNDFKMMIIVVDENSIRFYMGH